MCDLVGENREKHAKQVGSQTSPDNAFSFKFHRIPISLISKGRSIDVDSGSFRAIALFLYEGGLEAKVLASQ